MNDVWHQYSATLDEGVRQKALSMAQNLANEGHPQPPLKVNTKKIFEE